LVEVSIFFNKHFLKIQLIFENVYLGSHCTCCALFLESDFKFQFLDPRPFRQYPYVLGCDLLCPENRGKYVYWMFHAKTEVQTFLAIGQTEVPISNIFTYPYS
jgi:hypothetical protein